jgi:hypothetical protein
MTAAAIPKNHAMPMAMIQRGLRRSFVTVGWDSSFAAGEASAIETAATGAVRDGPDFNLEGNILLSCAQALPAGVKDGGGELRAGFERAADCFSCSG